MIVASSTDRQSPDHRCPAQVSKAEVPTLNSNRASSNSIQLTCLNLIAPIPLSSPLALQSVLMHIVLAYFSLASLPRPPCPRDFPLDILIESPTTLEFPIQSCSMYDMRQEDLWHNFRMSLMHSRFPTQELRDGMGD